MFMADYKDAKVNKRRISSSMGDAKVDVAEIQHNLHNMLVKDEIFGHLFAESNNSRINKFRNKVQGDLLKLVEIALLNKFGFVGDKARARLEERLASISKPTGFGEQSQLNMIDRYLSMQNGEALVREAFETVKPFFVQQMNIVLQDESRELLDRFKFEETQPDMLYNYFFTKVNPTYATNEVVNNYRTYNAKREAHKAVEAAIPFASEQYKRRTLM